MGLTPEEIQAIARALADELELRGLTQTTATVGPEEVDKGVSRLAELYRMDRAGFLTELKKQNAARRKQKGRKQ